MNRSTLARLVAIPSVVVATAGAAHAALPAAVETAITGYSTDAGTAIGLVIGAGVVIWGLMKLGRKFGWM
jgi:hypothetical protein